MINLLGFFSEDCGLPPAVDGDGVRACFAFIPSFSYHVAENACKQFIYGGCGGNNNRFNSLEECEAKCKE